VPIAVDRVVRARALWILERQRRRRDSQPAPPPRELVSGETFRYLGRQVRLVLDRQADVAPVRLEDSRLILPVPRGLPREHESDYARAALVDWYTARASRLLPRRAAACSPLVGAAPTRVLIADPGKRWGSAASDGTVRFNWRIIQAPAGSSTTSSPTSSCTSFTPTTARLLGAAGEGDAGLRGAEGAAARGGGGVW
jgi:predicted metal-dependent hydrolase